MSAPYEVRFSLAGEGYTVGCDDDVIGAAIDRWTSLMHHKSVEGLDVRVRVHAPGGPRIEAEGMPARCCDGPEGVLPAFEAMLIERLARPGRELAVGRAAVAAMAGKAVVFAGPPHSGKSVLSLALGRRGWKYLSDEIAPFDPGGRVHPVPRPVTFRSDDIDPGLWKRITANRTTWTERCRDSTGSERKLLFALPDDAASACQTYPVAAFYRLEPRARGGPRIRRMSDPEAEAWLSAQMAPAPDPATG